MAYSAKQKIMKKPIIGIEKVNTEEYRVSNARKVNSKKKPDGYIYILSIKEFDLYKIGVSANPHRRIKDIQSVLPFKTNLMFCKKFYEVYSVEETIHEKLKENKFKKEWYKMFEEDVYDLINILNELQQEHIKISMEKQSYVSA